MIRRIAVVFAALLLAACASAPREASVTILHFSDYHSHALPFYTEGEQNAAGIARAIAFLKTYAGKPDTLIFSGGDMLNAGAPVWSDKYECIEWPWLNGIVDAMAVGNHDSDYGPEEFQKCRASAKFSLLSANTVDANGKPLFLTDGKPYVVFNRGGIRIGAFAIAGPGFDALVKPQRRPYDGARYTDPVAAARTIVQQLSAKEKVNAIVLIGHEQTDDDIALARAVPGIDLILGTHAHLKQELQKIDGTQTWMISPFQYLTYVSRVNLKFANGHVAEVTGGLVRMSASLPEHSAIRQQVDELASGLEHDPKYASLFENIGSSPTGLSAEEAITAESTLGDFVTDVMRSASHADVAISAASSFRQSIAPGTIKRNDLRNAMPYDNRLVMYRVTGADLKKLLDASVSRRGTDSFSQVSGVKFRVAPEGAADIRVQRRGTTSFDPLDPIALYQVATSDHQGKLEAGYKEIFAGKPMIDTGISIRDAVEEALTAKTPVTVSLDGRITDK